MKLLAIAVVLAACGQALAADGGGLLAEGFPIEAVDGRLSGPDDEGRWFFEFGSSVSDGQAVLEAGHRLQMLPSAALERMTDDRQRQRGGHFSIWGRITRYKGRNFLFASYFLPLERQEPSEPAADAPPMNEPQDGISLPSEITDKLQKRPMIRAGRLRRGPPLEKGDSTLSNQRGVIITQADGQAVFIRDGLGRNIEQARIYLLPCAALERAMRNPPMRLSRPYYTVAGLVTRCGNRPYLLLERATKTYGYGNFGPSVNP
jgi:hypothetical protein